MPSIVVTDQVAQQLVNAVGSELDRDASPYNIMFSVSQILRMNRGTDNSLIVIGNMAFDDAVAMFEDRYDDGEFTMTQELEIAKEAAEALAQAISYGLIYAVENPSEITYSSDSVDDDEEDENILENPFSHIGFTSSGPMYTANVSMTFADAIQTARDNMARWTIVQDEASTSFSILPETPETETEEA